MAGTKRSKIKKNDQVAIIAGRDKGRRGRVLEVLPAKGKVKVEGAGMIKRHQKANRRPESAAGGIVGLGSFIDHLERAVDRSASQASRARAV
jgi:large subunit ribosomal protein L24